MTGLGGTVYDQINTQLDGVAELSDEQVAELQSTIISEFEVVEGEDPTPETVDAMTALADSLDIVRGELARREALAEQLAAQAAEAAARVKGNAETSGEEMAMNEEPMEEEVPVEEVPMEEGPATEIEMETPEEEEDTPVEEDEKEKSMTEYSSDEEVATAPEVVEAVEEVSVEAELSTTDEATEDASIAQEDGSELSTDETSTQEETIIAEEVQQEEQAPVTAAAEESFSAPADRQPVVQVTEAPVAITAGADIPGYTAGTALSNMNEVASAMEKRLHTLRRVNGGDGEQHIVASFTTSYPEDRVLTTDAESNAQKIAAVAGPEALVASGGHSAPFEVKYDIYSIGSTSVRPLRDSLPRFQADRGGIRYIVPPTFANVTSNTTTYSTAVGVWTSANDSAETPSPAAKLSLTVAAASETTAQTDAVTLQLQFGNLMTRAYPELIARHNELALVQHAREAEEQLVSGINSGSTAVTTTNLIGFGRDFLVQVRRAAAGYRARHRLSPDARLKVVIPAWVYEAMAADLALAMPGDGTLSVSKSEIDGYLAQLNVDVVTVLDSTGTLAQSLNVFQAAGALNEFPDTFKWFLFAEGTFLFLDGGTLDLGIIRDSTLVGTNDYKMFIETFEAVAKVGIESLAITSTINVNGAAAALRDTTGGTAAATIEL
jgi:chemotaxis protein histidine kinase CheA